MSTAETSREATIQEARTIIATGLRMLHRDSGLKAREWHRFTACFKIDDENLTFTSIQLEEAGGA